MKEDAKNKYLVTRDLNQSKGVFEWFIPRFKVYLQENVNQTV